MRIAVIGSGISGLLCARMLHDAGRAVTVYERDARLGGHARTVEARFGADAQPVDVGFIVYNEPNYPILTRLFDRLDVATQASDMSFSVSLNDGDLEYAGSPRGVFAQPINALRPRFWRMTRDMLRFFRNAPAVADDWDETRSLGEWLRDERYSDAFIDDHLLPMAAAIWSCPTATMTRFPARSFLAFFRNHGLLLLRGRPRWRTVSGGSRSYVDKLIAPFADRIRCGGAVTRVRRGPGAAAVTVETGEERRYDAVVFATHAPDAARLLVDADADETALIGAFQTQPNEAVLHSDPALMPKRRRAWAAWSYIAAGDAGARRVSVSYWMNALQGIPAERPLFVSLNPLKDPDPARVHGRYRFAHPVFDQAAIAAQARLPEIQGRNRVWWCGAWTGFGFHEDGARSGLAAAQALGGRPPWETAPTAAPPRDRERAAAAPAA